ncbi:MAG: hypothetical protein HYV07_32455 [Deltaproteobacteria bacterium]|nr:hypothetical protein [Deltaproteobacteria bacterium]
MALPDVRIFEHESKLLANNLMGDPSLRRLPIYVPPGYDEARKDPYPVVFLLAGWSGRGAGYLNDAGCFTPSLADALDRAMQHEEHKAIIAFPDGTTKLGASQYVNSPAHGPHMDYVADELVEFVDSRFHTHRDRRFRGVIGHSSGGFGALILGMLRPDRFSAVTSSAGDSWYEFLYTHSLPQTIGAIRRAGGVNPFLERWLSSPNPRALAGRGDEAAMLNLSMCPCFAPNVSAPPLLGDLYFDVETGAIVQDVFARFLAWDPVHMADRHGAALKSLRFVHLEAGTDDEYGLCLGHRQLAKKLRAIGVEPLIDEYPGRHSGHHHRMPSRITRMVAAMRRP